MTHICVSKLTIIGSDNGLSPGRRQAIIWTNAGVLLIGTLGTNFNEILNKIHIFSFKKIPLKMSSAKWRPFCLGLNELKEHLPKNQQRPEKLVTLNLPKRIAFYCSCRWTETVSMILKSLKTIGRQFDNFVVTGGSCHHDNLRCHQWRQSCRIDNLLFSAIRNKSGYWFLRRRISVKASQITSNPTVWAKGNSVPQPWWRHQMETFSALLAIFAGNSPVPGEFHTQRPVTRSFDVYFDLPE